MEIRALTWNLFHGRDFPPDPRLRTWPSRLLGTSTRNATHVQVNRDLMPEFTHVLCSAPWDVALLQEFPPHWTAGVAAACGAEQHRVLTSRNALPPLRSFIARHRPDLIASNEGGSNLTLARPSVGPVIERRELVLRSGPRPERRTMALTRLAGGLCVANLHASTAAPLAVPELRMAGRAAVDWAGEAPLIFGGDLNVRPGNGNGEIYDELARDCGFRAPSASGAIDHILVRGLEIVEYASQWPPEARELIEGGLRLRLSDHAPVEARFSMQDGAFAGPPPATT